MVVTDQMMTMTNTMTMTTIRTYSELIKLPTLIERYNYLQLGGTVGAATFGFDRIFNQMFYRSDEWKDIRHEVIVRDKGCDLGLEDYEISGSIYIHHMNPIKLADIKCNIEKLLDPEYLISSSFNTHNAIHYGNKNKLPKPLIERSMHDTCPWR